jgi:hypothetical protein
MVGSTSPAPHHTFPAACIASRLWQRIVFAASVEASRQQPYLRPGRLMPLKPAASSLVSGWGD